MVDDRNDQRWEERKNQDPGQSNETRGSREDTTGQQGPQERLKDGTNDYQNGDQEPTSERSSNMDQSKNS